MFSFNIHTYVHMHEFMYACTMYTYSSFHLKKLDKSCTQCIPIRNLVFLPTVPRPTHLSPSISSWRGGKLGALAGVMDSVWKVSLSVCFVIVCAAVDASIAVHLCGAKRAAEQAGVKNKNIQRERTGNNGSAHSSPTAAPPANPSPGFPMGCAGISAPSTGQWESHRERIC